MKKFFCAAIAAACIVTAVAASGCDLGEATVEYTLSEDATHYIVSKVSGNKSALKSYEVPSQYGEEEGGALLPVSEIGAEAFFQCSSLRSLTIPDTVTKIGLRAFAGCAFTQFTIPDSVTFIDSGAFGFCTNLKEITIPKSVTALGPQAFANCSSLERAYVKADITALYYHTFYNGYAAVGGNAFTNTSLKELYLPASLQKIHMNALSGNFYMTDIYYAGTEQQWNEIYFFEMVKKEGSEDEYEEKKYTMSEALGDGGTVHYNVEF